MRRRSTLLALVVLPLALPGQPWQARRDPFAGIDSVVAQAMKAWKIPGLAIAVTSRDSVVFAKGYGVRRLGDPTPVDPQTIFAIGSASKAFTGASLAMLTDDGKVTMDDRVTDHLPYFEMYDPWVTREIRLRDLLLHRSGLERGELVWYNTTRSREEVVRSIRHLAPTTSFRSRFQYQNLMYITAGEVIRVASGRTWDDFVKLRIFTPLGMTGSKTSVRDLQGLANVAQPHAELDKEVRPIPYRNIDNAGAAGSINSNVVDMAKWVRLWLNGGAVSGRRLLSETMTREAMRSQQTMDDPVLAAMLGDPDFPGYAFGWFVAGFRGRRQVGHGGNIDGMSAMVGFLPDDGIGVVVLTNMNQNVGTVPLMNSLFDRALGVEPKDWIGEFKHREERLMAAMQAQGPPAAPTPGTRPSLPLEQYTGTYRHSLYGTASVRLEGSKLLISYDHNPNGTGDLEHHQYDSFTGTMRDPILGKAPVTFRVGRNGTVESMQFGLMGAGGEWWRVPAK
jgi:CubicO group peptidase (beta-lactamase class C family)